MRILVTGAAGFIGSWLSLRFLEQGHDVVGLDNLNPYYSVQLKQDRLARLKGFSNFQFHQMDLSDGESIARLFRENDFSHVVHLAAQAGVRYRITHPEAYVSSNLVGFSHILEACRHNTVSHLVYASSSSVYGLNTAMPFSVHQNVDHPVSMYAATKKSNELMAHAYSHLYAIPTTGLRFFTVYGPWGRPDMALFLFTKAILENRPIQVFNNGEMMRDFTYIDDIVEGIARVTERIPTPDPTWSGDQPDPARSPAPYALYNIGNNNPVKLGQFIQTLEQALGKEAVKEYLPMQPGDVPATYADVEDLSRDVGFRPSTSLEEGIGRFISWYREYYRIP